ncbi:MAG: FecR family protein [Bryobacteraceae bacterium]
MKAGSRSLAIFAVMGTMPLGLWAQRYVISARPGAVNYVEGSAFVNGEPVARKQIGKSFLQPNDVVSTGIGKAEILLIPGTFLRIGSDSAVRMVKLSLIDIQVRVERGEAMLEVDELTKDNNIRILPGTGSGSVLIRKRGLYRFSANGQPTIAVLKGKAEVSYEGRTVRLGKHHEVALAQGIEKLKFNKKKEDDLYAWSNGRSEYESAASYQTAESAWQNRGLYTAFGGFAAPGWAWNPMFSSWAWLPGAGMSFFSPFGFGFFAPAVVSYAPICYASTRGGRWAGPWHGGLRRWVPVAVNPAHPPATGAAPRSIAEQRAASNAARRTFREGFHTSSGSWVPSGSHWEGGYRGTNHVRRPHVGHWSRTSAGARPHWSGAPAGQHPHWSGGGMHRGAWRHAAGGGNVHYRGRSGVASPRMSGGMSRGSVRSMGAHSTASRGPSRPAGK